MFGWVRAFEFPDQYGTVVGVGGRLPGSPPSVASFRHNPAAHSQAGLELGMVVATKTDLERWVEHLDWHRVPHTPIIDATICWLVVLHDPDGHEIHRPPTNNTGSTRLDGRVTDAARPASKCPRHPTGRPVSPLRHGRPGLGACGVVRAR